MSLARQGDDLVIKSFISYGYVKRHLDREKGGSLNWQDMTQAILNAIIGFAGRWLLRKLPEFIATLIPWGGAIARIIIGIYGTIVWLVDNWENLGQLIRTFADGLKAAVDGIADTVKTNVLRGITRVVRQVIELIANVTGLQDLVRGLSQTLLNLQSTVSGWVQTILNILVTLAGGALLGHVARARANERECRLFDRDFASNASKRPQGSIRLGNTNKLLLKLEDVPGHPFGRATGARARLTRTSIRQHGSEAGGYQPPGWRNVNRAGRTKIARTHVLGNVLGGPGRGGASVGTAYRHNLITACQVSVNKQMWNRAERIVRERVNRGIAVDYEVIARYRTNTSPIPFEIHIRAMSREVGSRGRGLRPQCWMLPPVLLINEEDPDDCEVEVTTND